MRDTLRAKVAADDDLKDHVDVYESGDVQDEETQRDIVEVALSSVEEEIGYGGQAISWLSDVFYQARCKTAERRDKVAKIINDLITDWATWPADVVDIESAGNGSNYIANESDVLPYVTTATHQYDIERDPRTEVAI